MIARFRLLIETHWLVPMLLISAWALLLRFIFSGLPFQVSPDSMAYWHTAQAFLSAQWQDAFIDRTPGYPFFVVILQCLSAWLSPAATQLGEGQKILQGALIFSQTLLGVLTGLMGGDAVRRLSGKALVGLFAGLLIVSLPDLILYEHAFLSESLYTFALTALWWFTVALAKASDCRLARALLCLAPLRKALLFGVLCGLLVLIRPIALGAVVSVFIWLLILKRHHALPLSLNILQQRFNSIAAVFLMGLSLVIFAWMHFNYQAHGRFALAAGGGPNQLYKLIDHTDWQSPLERPYKEILHQRYNLHPSVESLHAVNDVHVLMMQKAGIQPGLLSKYPGNYSSVYLAHEQSAANIAKETIAANPFIWFTETIKQGWVLIAQFPTPILQNNLMQLWAGVSYSLWQILALFFAIGTLLAFCHRLFYFQMAGLIVLGHWALYPILTVADARYRIPLEPLMAVLSVLACAYLMEPLFSKASGLSEVSDTTSA